LAQGAAMAVEDGIVIAECISRAATLQSIPVYLQAFESIRKERTYLVQTGSVKNEDFWHMEDGARQRARDAIMKGVEIDADTLQELKSEGKNPNQWSDPTFQEWLFGYDAVAEVLVVPIFMLTLGKSRT
jgi:salicylate hydroxylase